MVFKKHSKLKAHMLLLSLVFSLSICAPCHAEFYRYNIDELARKAKARLQEIEKKIAEEKIANELQGILAELLPLFEKAESLYAEKRYEEAVTSYRKIDRMSRDPKITKWILSPLPPRRW